MHSEVIREGVAGGLVDAAEEVIRAGHQPTLRDRFAMAALQGLLHDTDERDRQHAPMAHQTPDVVARAAYELADAMMKARAATPAESMLSFCPTCNATDAAVRRATCRDAWHGYNPRRCDEPAWMPSVGDLVEMYDMPNRDAVRVAEVLPGWRFLLDDGSDLFRDCHVSNLKPADSSEESKQP